MNEEVKEKIRLILRKQRQELHRRFRLQRATMVYGLCTAFQEYHLALACKTRATNNISYLEAEKIAENMSEMFGIPIDTDEILPKTDLYDESIVHYNNYKKIKENILEIIRVNSDDIDAFVKMVEFDHYNKGLTTLYCFAAVGYSTSMGYVCKYFVKECNEEELLQNLKIFIPHEMVVMSKEARYYFAKTMFRIEREFIELITKRDRRKYKKRLASLAG